MTFEPTQVGRYRSILKELMDFKDNMLYQRNEEFTQEQLLTIRPQDVARWMCLKAYGTPDPAPGDNPTHGRCSSLEYYKKALSYFMPNRHNGWDEVTLRGNPTKSREVLDVIKAVKKKEVRRQGRPSQARRPMEIEELRQLLEMCCNFDEDDPKRFWLPSYLKYQFHMIARNDDVAHIDWDSIMSNPQYDFALKTKLRWSKNVNEERDAPEQIMLGAADWKWCVILGLAIHLEVWIGAGTGMVNDKIFTAGENDNPDATKQRSATLLKELLESEEFVQLIEALLGLHSIRKAARTHCRRMGRSKDDCDYRGRWKGKKRIGDVYEDTILPYPDALVAETLCIGGAIRYSLRTGSGVDNAWIQEHVVPNIALRYNEAVCNVLGRALLWACFDPEASTYVPHSIKEHVVEEYGRLQQHVPEGENPIKKVRLVINGAEDQVVITSIDMDEENNEGNGGAGDGGNGGGGGGDGGNGGGGGGNVSRNDYLALLSETRNARTENRQYHEQQNNRMGRLEARMDHSISRMNANIQRIARWPAAPRRQGGNQAGNEQGEGGQNRQGQNQPPGNLSQHPRNLYVLWQEWEFGIGGRKAARLFTAAERGRAKHTYTRRKAAWDAIAYQVRAGHTAERAIDRLYGHYGRNLTATQIINQLRRDRAQHGGALHPALRG
jgi:hypothetical protein